MNDRERLGPGTAVALGVVLRVAVLLYFLATHGWVGQSWEHEPLSQNLAAGKGFVLNVRHADHLSYHMPLFPLLRWATIRLAGPGLELFYALHILFAAAFLWAVYLLAGRCFGRRAGVLAAIFAALDPGLILYQSYKIQVHPLASLLWALGLERLLAATFLSRPWLGAAAGAYLGFGLLAKSHVLSAFAAAPALLWPWRGARSKHAALGLAAAALVSGAILSPWVVRNYLIHSRLILFNTIGGEVLWLGNNPNSTGGVWTSDGRIQWDAAPPELRRRVEAAGETSQGDILAGEARRYIAADPAGFIRRSAAKFWYFWWFPPYYGSHHYQGIPAGFREGYKAIWAFFLGLAALGSFSALRSPSLRRQTAAGVLIGASLGMSLAHSFGYIEGRHRLMVMPAVLALASRGYGRLTRRVGAYGSGRPIMLPSGS